MMSLIKLNIQIFISNFETDALALGKLPRCFEVVSSLLDVESIDPLLDGTDRVFQFDECL